MFLLYTTYYIFVSICLCIYIYPSGITQDATCNIITPTLMIGVLCYIYITAQTGMNNKLMMVFQLIHTIYYFYIFNDISQLGQE